MGTGASLKIAYLILVHEAPLHVERLVTRLQSPSSWFFIHVDSRTDDATFRSIVGGVADRPRVTFVTRQVCRWGGWGIVRATLQALSQIVRSTLEPDFVILLSGRDYPLQSTETIERVLADYRFLSFIDVRALPDYGWNGRGTLDRFDGRALPEWIAPYGGSQWWILSGECAAFVDQIAAHDTDLTQAFEQIGIPDEHFFQTVIGNSTYRERTITLGGQPVFGAHYIDWRRGSPKMLEWDDHERLAATPALFARKFDMEKSASLLDWLDQRANNRFVSAYDRLSTSVSTGWTEPARFEPS